jgi:hypothetical protein
LNLFAYSGGVTLAAAQGGAEVCHLDASKGMVAWARENAALNSLEGAPIRWIVEDVQKFLEREIRRKKSYDAIVLDPPTFGRGAQGEVFKIETHITKLLENLKELLSDKPLFILFSCHTPGFTPTVLSQLLEQNFKGRVESGEMLLEADIHLMTRDLGFWDERDKAQSKRSGSERGGSFLNRKADEEDRLGEVVASQKTQISGHEVYKAFSIPSGAYAKWLP